MESKTVVLKLNDKRYLPTLPKAMNVDNQRKLESEFKRGTRDCIRGLTPELEVIVLPSILGVQANDVSFAQKAKEFWADYSVQPTVEGIRLNISMTKKVVRDAGGEREIDYPENPEDYMVYQIALQSSKVAKNASPEELDNYDFYLVDLEAEKRAEREEFQLQEQADMAYAKLISSFGENTNKINWLLELLRDKTEFIDVESLEELDKKMMLRKIKDESPKKFFTSVEDKSLEYKALIIRLHSYGILNKEGNTYFFGDEAIGGGPEAINWFKKAENSGKVLTINERLKAAVETKKI